MDTNHDNLDLDEIGFATKANEYVELNLDEIKSIDISYLTASHCMIYCKEESIVLMQMRSDGYLGFPGGRVDPGEDPIEALNRELIEEMALDTKKFVVTNKDFIVSYFSSEKKLLLFFYGLKVNKTEIHEIERNVLDARDFGKEIFGTLRVPLETQKDGYRGFPAFLSNSFIGNSKQQLIKGLLSTRIMNSLQIDAALLAVPMYLNK